MRFRAFQFANAARPLHLVPPPVFEPEELGDPWADLEWHEHLEAQIAVRRNPEGMTLEQIGSLMNITRERVRQIEATALRKLVQATGSTNPLIKPGPKSKPVPHGNEVIEIGSHTFAVPDCEKCGTPFVRLKGSDRHCGACATIRRRRRRH